MNILLIDLDFNYNEFKKHFLSFYLEHVNLILSKFNLKPLSIEHYPSTNGNTHIKILLDKDVDCKTYLHLLVALGCDLGLVSISDFRLKAFGNPLIKQFYFKERKKEKDG
jgi:hypothetical protein